MKTKLRYFNYSLCKSKCFCRRYFFSFSFEGIKKCSSFLNSSTDINCFFAKLMSTFLRHFLILQILQRKKHIEWIICGAIQRPIFLFCSNHVSHCEWNAFQSAYTFSFFLSLCSLTKIKLKLIHSVRCMWMWGGKCSSKKLQKTTTTNGDIRNLCNHHRNRDTHKLLSIAPHWVSCGCALTRSNLTKIRSYFAKFTRRLFKFSLNSIQKWQLDHLWLASEGSFGQIRTNFKLFLWHIYSKSLVIVWNFPIQFVNWIQKLLPMLGI